MKISYRFFDNFSRNDVFEFKKIGIDIAEGIDAFEVYESDEVFEKVKEKFGAKWAEHVSITDTHFTEKEKSNSLYLNIAPLKMLGYPQPEDWDEDEGEKEPPYPFNIYPYFENVFEVANTSPDYGLLRGKQTGFYSLLGEPKWGKSGIGSVFWSQDAFFTTPEIYTLIFEPLGIKSLQVIGYGNQKPLQTVVQLLPQGVAESKLLIKEDQIKETSDIKEWNMKKYDLNRKGFFPSFEKSPGRYDFFASQEYFGPGGVNEKAVFISQKIYELLKKIKIGGLSYYPQELIP